MRLRQAKKIMKNFQLYTGMLWIYRTERFCELCINTRGNAPNHQ
nr:MAG TPA: hypothetical protein [Caudoviricetes sp.]